jgi:hypothetical protein
MRLRVFRERLEKMMGDSAHARPFVCDGDPYACRAFVVGINPASSVPFWPFWDDETGFDRARWYASYLAQRNAVSQTRRRIAWIAEAASPFGILETNLHADPTARAAALPAARRQTGLFEFLLEEIRPRAVLLHGKPAAEYFRRAFGCRLGSDFSATTVNDRLIVLAASRHLYNVSRKDADRLGFALRDACVASD